MNYQLNRGLTASPASVQTPQAVARRSGLLDRPLIGVVILAALTLPLIVRSPYLLNLLIVLSIYAIFNQSWNLVLGVSGIFSFAHLALFGVGAYTSVLLNYHYDVSPYIGTLAGALVAVVASLLIGLPSLRLRGIYVVLLTLAFHEILRNLIVTDTTKWTGGGFGLFNYSQYGLENLDQVTRLTIFYYVALALLVLCSYVMWWIMHSALGLAFRALRDSESYALARGVAEYRYKLLVFGTSAFFAGLAGAFYAHYLGAVSPSILSFGLMMNLLAMIVIGGLGSYWGPLIGTVMLVVFNELLRGVDQWRLIVLGSAMAAVMIWLPSGLVGPLGRMKNAIGVWMEEWLTDEEVAGEDSEGQQRMPT
jgi:branched-chain amino acid transport system permease protein